MYGYLFVLKSEFCQSVSDFRVLHKQFPNQSGTIVFSHYRNGTLIDGQIALAGRYPSRDDLARWAGITTVAAAPSAGACCAGSRCC